MIAIMDIYNECLKDGFTETQAKRLTILYEHQEEKWSSVESNIRNDINEIKTLIIKLDGKLERIETKLDGRLDKIETKLDVSFDMLFKMICALGAVMAVGFGLFVYFIKA